MFLSLLIFNFLVFFTFPTFCLYNFLSFQLFPFLSFCLLVCQSFCLFDFLTFGGNGIFSSGTFIRNFLTLCPDIIYKRLFDFMSRYHFNQISERSQVSKLTLCVQIQKWHWLTDPQGVGIELLKRRIVFLSQR